ncbi:MAG: ATP-binding protein [Bacteroidales bacterium]|jgi:anti-sigma regulatory factor (Ser/Thr protein kinase)|nr:ATP-binding protein [Bacteroidales bacterium]
MNDLSMHVLDIVQNSITAGANLIGIEVIEKIMENTLTICISDNGKGMSPEQLIQVTNPYFTTRTTRKVGLGVPLFKQNAEMSGGSFNIESNMEKGTIVTAVFGYNHLDRPPLGDMANVVVLLVSSNPALDFIYTHRYNEKTYIFDTREVKEVLIPIPVNEPRIIRMLTEMILENCKDMKEGKSN